MSTIRRTFKLDGVLTDMTSVELSNEAATVGVKRDDTDASVVAAGTAMARASTGVYTYTFTDPADDLTYTYWIEVTYGGETYWIEYSLTGPTSAAAAAAAVPATVLSDTIKTTAENPAEVEQDGTRVKAQAVQDQIAADRYLKSTAAAERGATGLRFMKLVPPGSA